MKSFKKSSLMFSSLLLLVGLNSAPQVSKAAEVQKVTEITTEEGEKIGIGNAQVSGLNSFKSIDTSNTKIDQKKLIDGNLNSVKQIITIDSVSSDTKIDIPLQLDNGDYIKLYQDEKGKVYNSGNIYNKENESIGIITTNIIENEDIKVKADIVDSDTLQLSLKPESTSQSIQMEVMATSGSTFSTYFSSGSWITRDGVKSLSLKHKSYLTTSTDVGEAGVKKADSWNKVKSKFSSSSNWYNTGGLKDQYDCHFGFAKSKNPWNLEPSRPDVSYAVTVAKLCNP